MNDGISNKKSVLKEPGVPYQVLSEEERLKINELDITTTMMGLENLSFDECLHMASSADLEGIKVPFLHINHLIENKKNVNWPKDQIDVIELEKIKKLRENEKL